MELQVCVVSMSRKLCTKAQTLEVIYYKHVVIINLTRCDTVCLESLTDIGDVGNLKIIVRVFKSQNQYAWMQKI